MRESDRGQTLWLVVTVGGGVFFRFVIKCVLWCNTCCEGILMLSCCFILVFHLCVVFWWFYIHFDIMRAMQEVYLIELEVGKLLN